MADVERLLPPSSRALAPADYLTLCRALYAQDRFDDALPECDAAASALASSAAFDWLGRVEGQRADHANPLTAFALARKAHAAFVRAQELDPASPAAIGDLGEYLVQAPAIVGGGLDQARSLARSSLASSPSAAHRVMALADQHTEDPASAEREWRAAVATAHGDDLPGAWIDLARFLLHRQQRAEALSAVRSAIRNDSAHGPALVDAARLLGQLQQPASAQVTLLRQYLASAARSDAAPAFKVHYQLASLFDQQGDSKSAAQERDIARTLAPNFSPHNTAARSNAHDDASGQVR